MAHLFTDEQLKEFMASDPAILGKVNLDGTDYLLIKCPECGCVRLADYQCPQCNYETLKRKVAPIKAALKQISGLVDKSILDLDCGL